MFFCGKSLADGPLLVPELCKLGGGKLGATAQRVYYILTSTLAATPPVRGTVHPDFSYLNLESWEGVPQGDGTFHLVTESYIQWDLTEVQLGGDVPVPEVLPIGEKVEVDIRQHPAFYGSGDDFPYAPWSQYWDFEAGKFRDDPTDPAFTDNPTPGFLIGLSKWVIGSGSVSITTYSFTEPDAATVRGVIGKLMDAPGQGFTGHWLVTAAAPERRKPWWAFTVVFQFSADAWPTEVYGDVISDLSFGDIANADFLGAGQQYLP